MLDHKKYLLNFTPSAAAVLPAWYLIFQGTAVLVDQSGGGIRFPDESELAPLKTELSKKQYVGEFNGHPCYCVKAPDGLAQGKFVFLDVRSLHDTGEPELYTLAGTANHLMHWSSMNRFCGRCGGPMNDKENERAKQCPACGAVVYPRISPAVITAVRRGDEILLAHNNAFENGMYSVIAGFVEPGEKAEEAAAREIMEETGIRVRNLTYFGSQPWPFPDSLMLAYTAEFDGGDIHVDGVEIGHADWFKVEDIPFIPSTVSVAGRMIRAFIQSVAEGK